MKLSEFSADKALDVLCAITPYVCNIASDGELLSAAKAKVMPAGDSTVSKAQMVLLGAQKISELLPLFLSKHRSDVYGILSAIYETSVDTIAKQPVLKTLSMAREVVADEDLLSFFGWPAKRGGGE